MNTDAGGCGSGLTVREVTEHLASAFIAPGASTADLLAAAIRTRARPGLREALRRLPHQRFDSISDVLAALPTDAFAPAARPIRRRVVGRNEIRRSGRRR